MPGEIKTAYQNPQLGTGHAVMTARAFVEQHKGDDILILNGDGPLMDEPTINAAYDYHKSNENSITLVSAIADDTEGIGHIKRDESGKLLCIVEHKDANELLDFPQSIFHLVWLLNRQRLWKENN